MKELPTHSITGQFDSVIFAKRISPATSAPVAGYTHRDKYSVFGMVLSGSCSVEIDFAEYWLETGDAMYVGPDQVHRLTDISNAEVCLLFIDTGLIAPAAKHTLDYYALRPTPLHASTRQSQEIQSLFELLIGRIGTAASDIAAVPEGCSRNSMYGSAPQPAVRHLACAIAEIVAEIAGNSMPPHVPDKRHVHIVLALKQRLAQHDAIDRSPSRHAAALNISASYLNEAVRSVAGTSASRFIADETLLRAKRRLVYTNASIKQIAAALGFDDSAYFTRFFTKAEGTSPTSYRKRHLG